MKVLYFTSTGNCLWVARQFSDEPVSIIELLRSETYGITDDEAIGIVVPNHVSDLPRPVKQFLSKAQMKAPYKFAIVTYGSEIASTVDELLKLKHFDYVNILLTVDNYFPMFSLEQQLRDEPRKRTDEHMASILKDIEERKRYINRPGLMKRITGYVEHLVFPLLGQTVKRYSVGHAQCAQCGICSKVCPMDNISYDPWPHYGDNCIMCGSCRQNCPHNAIRYKGEKDELQYRNPHVTVKDIITANNPCSGTTMSDGKGYNDC